MTLGRLLHRGEFTPVPSRGSVFVYMIPPQISAGASHTEVSSPQFYQSEDFTPVCNVVAVTCKGEMMTLLV